jgi:hypothetical protein
VQPLEHQSLSFEAAQRIHSRGLRVPQRESAAQGWATLCETRR